MNLVRPAACRQLVEEKEKEKRLRHGVKNENPTFWAVALERECVCVSLRMPITGSSEGRPEVRGRALDLAREALDLLCETGLGEDPRGRESMKNLVKGKGTDRGR